MLGVERPRHQTGAVERVDCLSNLRDQLHLAVDDVRLVGIGDFVVRRKMPGGDLLGQVDHSVEGVARVLGESRPFRQGGDLEPLIQHEVQVPPGQDQGRHTDHPSKNEVTVPVSDMLPIRTVTARAWRGGGWH